MKESERMSKKKNEIYCYNGEHIFNHVLFTLLTKRHSSNENTVCWVHNQKANHIKYYYISGTFVTEKYTAKKGEKNHKRIKEEANGDNNISEI